MNELENKYFRIILGVLFFLSLLRYKGFDSDAALYLLQVIHHLYPERFVNDVPFMFGNQDSFSVFSPFIACVYRLFGVNAGGLLATFLMLVAWGALSVTFVVKWAERFGLKRWTALIVVAFFTLLLNKEYGSGCFYLPIMEPFLVARVISAIFVLAGLAYMFGKNKFVPLVFFVFATVMHPLMGGWSLPLWLFYHYPKARIPVVVLSLLSPLSGFLHVGRLGFYPPDWRPLYYTPGMEEFVSYSGLLLFWLLMYYKFKGGNLARFSISLFLVSLIGFALQFLGCFSAHLFLYQVQPFRVQWLCFVPVVPVFAIYLKEVLAGDQKMTVADYGGIILGMCTIANQQWVFILFVALFWTVHLLRLRSRIVIKQSWIKILFVVGFVFLFANSVLGNFVQLALEQNLGDVGRAVGWMGFSQKAMYVEMIVVALLTLISVSQRRFGVALALGMAFCNPDLKMIALSAILFFLVPNIEGFVKNLLIAITAVVSYAELLASLDELNSIHSAPLQSNPILSVIFLVLLFAISLRVLYARNNANGKRASLPLFFLLLLLGWWNICVWDARGVPQVNCERQMDDFFEKPLFPQIPDRGKMLFAVEYESPIQSRINFLTGAYVDESIYVGEVFFKEQYKESIRRRSALLRGDSIESDMTSFKRRVQEIYKNPDTLLARVEYLCRTGEISHFVTDYRNMRLPKQDSLYLDKRQLSVWLYGCPEKGDGG